MIMTLLAAMASQPLDPSIADLLTQTREEAVVGERLWPGFVDAPFGLLLVSEEGETLLCEDRLPDGFVAQPDNEQLDCSVATGPSSWRQPSLLAAMAAFGPPDTIVIGTPQATGLAPLDWQRTVLHEHFHQWQSVLPGYYERVEALDLAGGDQSGMWMINYPFPYEDPKVIDAFEKARVALQTALFASDSTVRDRAAEYLEARALFADTVGEGNWRYFDFQLWKEGVARWTDITIGLALGDDAGRAAREFWEGEQRALDLLGLAQMKRSVIYPFGAAEAALLDRLSEDWRQCYEKEVTMTPCWTGVL